ncbi:MAG: KamA family radical SAM protein, partial [bacterium]
MKLLEQKKSKEWNDWRWQIENSVDNIEDLEKFIDLTEDERKSIREVSKKYRFRLTPYNLSLIDKNNPNCPIRKQFIPSITEIEDERGWSDPKNEEHTSPVDCLMQLYPDRLILYLTNSCATFCRHCIRKRRFCQNDTSVSNEELKKAFDYIKTDKNIRDILVTGGDPFLCSDEKIEFVLSELRKIPHVEIIRLGTRTLSTLPQRITEKLADMIEKYHPVWINTQFNHYKEITTEAKKGCEILLKRGIPLGNQSVLLKGINDDVATMKKLIQELGKIRVRPYYIYHCHFVKGGMHFQTSINKGKEIIRQLQGFTSGFLVPRYIISTPK